MSLKKAKCFDVAYGLLYVYTITPLVFYAITWIWNFFTSNHGNSLGGEDSVSAPFEISVFLMLLVLLLQLPRIYFSLHTLDHREDDECHFVKLLNEKKTYEKLLRLILAISLILVTKNIYVKKFAAFLASENTNDYHYVYSIFVWTSVTFLLLLIWDLKFYRWWKDWWLDNKGAVLDENGKDKDFKLRKTIETVIEFGPKLRLLQRIVALVFCLTPTICLSLDRFFGIISSSDSKNMISLLFVFLAGIYCILIILEYILPNSLRCYNEVDFPAGYFENHQKTNALWRLRDHYLLPLQELWEISQDCLKKTTSPCTLTTQDENATN